MNIPLYAQLQFDGQTVSETLFLQNDLDWMGIVLDSGSGTTVTYTFDLNIIIGISVKHFKLNYSKILLYGISKSYWVL